MQFSRSLSDQFINVRGTFRSGSFFRTSETASIMAQQGFPTIASTKIGTIGYGAYGKCTLISFRGVTCLQKAIPFLSVGSEAEKAMSKQQAAREVDIMKMMNHPNIVQFYNSFAGPNALCIVMEYCSKGDLNDKIYEVPSPSFKEPIVLRWLNQLCSAVGHVHSCIILHRDIKPKNIFLTDTEDIKLGDFGIAKSLESPINPPVQPVGTPQYMAPELLQRGFYNTTTDIWSVGCVLYEICKKEKLYPSGPPKTPSDVYHIIPNIAERYSLELYTLMKGMLRLDPQRRVRINVILSKLNMMEVQARSTQVPAIHS